MGSTIRGGGMTDFEGKEEEEEVGVEEEKKKERGGRPHVGPTVERSKDCVQSRPSFPARPGRETGCSFFRQFESVSSLRCRSFQVLWRRGCTRARGFLFLFCFELAGFFDVAQVKTDDKD